MKPFTFIASLAFIALSHLSCAQQSDQQTSTQPHNEPTTQSTSAPAATPQVVDIDVDQFEQMMAQPEVVVLDVRTPQEVAQGTITDRALNIDVTNRALFDQEIEKLDKDKTYLVYCRSGRRSRVAGEEMVRRGFKKVYNLKGGILAWQEARAKQ